MKTIGGEGKKQAEALEDLKPEKKKKKFKKQKQLKDFFQKR